MLKVFGVGTLSSFAEASGVASANRFLYTFAPLSEFEQARELVGAIQHLSLADSVPEIQEIVRASARRLTGADGATFILRDGEHSFYAAEDAISPLWEGQRFSIETCIGGWSMLNRRPAVIEDIYVDRRIQHDVYRATFIKSLAMVPVRTLDPVGAIGNYWAERHLPTAREVELLQALADSTAVAMENVRVYQELEDERLETLKRLALAAEYRDDATYEHTQRVARTTRFLARGLGLSETQVSLIGQAAPLHDIGKLAVSDSILLKPERLTDDEFEQVKGHAALGADILSGSTSEVLGLAQEIALTHHEWWDGGGYPSGMRGEEIPLSGRLVALADVFDALTHERPYKSAWSTADSAAEIRRLNGKQFDPQVVDAFLGLDPRELVQPLAS